MGCEYSSSQTDGLDNPTIRSSQKRAGSVIFTLKKMPVWGEPATTDGFEWPTLSELYEMPVQKFHLKSIHFKSVNDGLNVGICSVRCELSNGVSSGELSVDGVRTSTSGVIHVPADQTVIRKVQAYSDECGVFNIYMKDEQGNVVCSYDPKNYGEISTGKFEIDPLEEIIGVYGTQPNMGSNIFSSLGLIVLSRRQIA